MPQNKPNVLLIILDTLRRDRLSIYGNQRETSPHFDVFANDATLFERAISPAQWTIPAHASLFTGLYPSTHQLTEAGHVLSGSYPTLAEILQVEGYRTMGFCNNPLVGVLNNGLKRGFDEFYNYAGAAVNRPIDVRKSTIRKAFSKQWMRFAQAVSNQFAHSDWLFRKSMNPRLVPIWTRYINYNGHTENSISDLIDTLQTHRTNNDDIPYFGFLNLMGAHLPYRPPQDYLHRVAPKIKGDKHAYKFMARFNAEASRWASPTEPPLSAEEQAIIDGFYQAEIAYQDYHLGRLLRYLQDADALKDTMVIIAADHGEGHGDHNFFGHSFVVYQELVHVPLVIAYPDHFSAGKRISKTVSTRRIFHTILEAVGVTSPPMDASDPNADVQGLSLARALDDSKNDFVYAEAFPPQTFVNLIRHRQPHLIDKLHLTQVRRGIYDGTHKLAVVGEQVEGLFDVASDPNELQDVSSHAGEMVDTLQRKLRDFVQTAEHYRADGGAFAEVNPEVEDHLRALGYIE